MVDLKKATIIGSRKVSMEEFNLLRQLGYWLCKNGVDVVSGHAGGSDWAGEVGAQTAMNENHKLLGSMEIWLPREGFNGARSDGIHYFVLDAFMFNFAWELLDANGVKLNYVAEWTQQFFTRNVFQIVTLDYRCTDVVIYCSDETRTGTVKGGTRIAVHLARAMDIPCFNIRKESDRSALKTFLKEKGL